MKKNLLRLLLFVIAGLLPLQAQEIQTETFDNGTLPVPRGGNTVTLSYDNLPSTGVGLAGKRYIAAIRFDASTLVAYPEYSLNSVDVYLRDIPHNGFFLNIYRGGNSSAPGALVYKKFVAPSQLFSYSWNNITIDTTLSVINNNSDIWVGIDILAVTGQTVFMSLDSGPGNPNGSKIFIENQWRNLSFFGQGINKNWNLKLKIAGPSTQLPAKVQIVHNSPEPVAKNVDVFVNGQRVLSNFEYKKATPFLDFQPNTAYSISLTLPGQPLSSAVVTFNASFNEGENYVAAVQGDLQTGLRLVARPGAEVTGILGVGRIYATHGSPDAPEVDIRERTAGVLFSGVSFGEFTNYISLPLADYTLDFTLPGLSTPVVSFRVDLSAVAAIVAPVFATGYLNPASSSAPGFGLFAVLTDGTVIEFPKVPSIPPPPPPTGSFTAKISDSTFYFNPGNLDFLVPVKMQNTPSQGYISYQLEVLYDTTYFRAPGLVNTGTLTGSNGWSALANTLTPGVIRVGAFGAGNISSDGDLIKLKFALTGREGSSQIKLRNFVVNSGNPVVQTVNGNFTLIARVCGDANVDGSVFAEDASLTLQHSIGIITLTPQGIVNADVDGSGNITSFDAALILRSVLGLPQPVNTCFGGSLAKSPSMALDLEESSFRMTSGNGLFSLSNVASSEKIYAMEFDITSEDGIISATDLRYSGQNIIGFTNRISNNTYRIAVISADGFDTGDFTVDILNSSVDPAVSINNVRVNGNSSASFRLNSSTVETPGDYNLAGAYPNPFNPTTNIQFSIPSSGFVTLEVYDILGSKVRTLLADALEAGTKTVTFDAKDDSGRGLASGNYIVLMRSGSFVKSIKINLLK